jgi:hypothetical protein
MASVHPVLGAKSASARDNVALEAAAYTPVHAEDLLRHPRFSEAVRLHIQKSLDNAIDPFACEIFGDAARQIIFGMIGLLSARNELDPSAAPLTPKRLHEALKPWGLMGHGKIDTLLHRMTDRGILTKTRHPTDLRAIVLQPTEAYLVMFDTLSATHTAPASMLLDDRLLQRVAAGDRHATLRYRACELNRVEVGMAILQSAPRMLGFLRYDAGWLILFALMDATARDDDGARSPSVIARRFGVSRPHVNTVLTTNAAEGLLIETAPGRFAPSAALRETVDRWIAECLAVSANCCRQAQAACPYLPVSD